MLPKAKFILDKFHMHKYIIAATSHLADSAEDAISEIYRAIHKTGKKHVKMYLTELYIPQKVKRKENL